MRNALIITLTVESVVDTYSYKKIHHKKYVEGKIYLLSYVFTPFFAMFHSLTAKKHFH